MIITTETGLFDSFEIGYEISKAVPHLLNNPNAYTHVFQFRSLRLNPRTIPRKAEGSLNQTFSTQTTDCYFFLMMSIYR